MNPAQAKEILLLYRPGTRDAEDPQIAEAIRLAQEDPELGQWFEQHQAFQASMRAKLRQLGVPSQLKESILAAHKIVRPPVFWQRPLWIAAAAIFVALFALANYFLRPAIPNRFSDYRETMVSAAVRVYGMDMETNNQSELRQFFARKGAPADYRLSPGLEKLQLRGGGLLRWRGNPVSMVCFDRGGNRMLFLFVSRRSAFKSPPADISRPPELAQVDGLMTGSWSHGDNTYVLAGSEEPGFAQKYVQP